MVNNILANCDLEIARLIDQEQARQTNKLELIASENFVSEAVLTAAGSILTNKYAEGYPGKRYYGGCEVVDKIEELACSRLRQLFNAEYANVQPHSGSSANMSVYLALLEPGDTILSMDLSHGGHLTHGSPVSFSGKLYNACFYGVSQLTERLDYDEIDRIAEKCRPKLIICGYSAYPRQIDFVRMREIADNVGALLMADMAHISGLVAAELHPTPIPYAHVTTTTTHKTLRGPRGGAILVGRDGENLPGIRAKKSGRVKRYSELLDAAVMPGIQGGPLIHIIAAKAVAFKEALDDSFVEYQRQILINAHTLADSLMKGGARLVSGGTDNHLMLVDVTPFGITGRMAEETLDKANITVNKNTIPFDSNGPMTTSGIRLGVPALTSRGMREDEMRKIASFILKTLQSRGDSRVIETVSNEVTELTCNFSLPGVR